MIDQTETENTIWILCSMVIIFLALFHCIIALLLEWIVKLAIVLKLQLTLKIHFIALSRLAFFNKFNSVLDLHDFRWSQMMELNDFLPTGHEMMRVTCFVWNCIF